MMTKSGKWIIPVLVALSPIGCGETSTPSMDATSVTIRCAVIGGMMDTGFWQGVSERFTKQTGIPVEVVAVGPKQIIAGPFERGEADIITMHACDTIINLVADGHGADPQPWARNDLLLVGPESDPAQIKGEPDVTVALRKIIKAKAKFLVHQSLGTNEVLHDLLAKGELELDAGATISLPIDRHRTLLKLAAKEQAYTIVGRIPFLNGKIPNDGLQIMVRDDPRMRRPYVVVVRVPNKKTDPTHEAALRLAKFLRTPETQSWIKTFGVGVLDDRPLFFPVSIPK
jgi:tungstate transport system substrate-binding protein